jgi:phosphoribosylanthranilate isomerase
MSLLKKNKDLKKTFNSLLDPFKDSDVEEIKLEKVTPKKILKRIKGLHIKVCGITQVEQFKQLESLGVDYVGFIFYPQSKRYVGEAKFNNAELLRMKSKVSITAVFVNPTTEEINKAVALLPNITTIQLHGNEETMLCKYLQKKFTVIKAFSVDENFALKKETDYYKNCCDYFLFDTKVNEYGGSGLKFDWRIFRNQIIAKPFFLSGGINETDAKEIKKFSHPKFYGIDLNSKFETEPGIKDIKKIEKFINDLNV